MKVEAFAESEGAVGPLAHMAALLTSHAQQRPRPRAMPLHTSVEPPMRQDVHLEVALGRRLGAAWRGSWLGSAREREAPIQNEDVKPTHFTLTLTHHAHPPPPYDTANMQFFSRGLALALALSVTATAVDIPFSSCSTSDALGELC